MSYNEAVGFIGLLVVIMILGCISFIHKDDDIIHGAIKYGHPLEIVGDCAESLFQVIMISKARLEDKIDHNVLYGALEKELLYISDIPDDILDKLVYGKFYECLVYKGEKDQIDFIELKGV